MQKWIIDQDRENLYVYDSAAHIYSEEIHWSSVYFGHNLMYCNVLTGYRAILGTFDGLDEVITEMARIRSSADEIVVVSGYCRMLEIINEIEK